MATEGARVQVGWEPAPRPGWVAPHLEAGVPGLSLATVEVRRPPGPPPRAGPPSPPGPLQPPSRRRGDPPARPADPLGLPGLLPADRARSRPRPDPDRAAGPRPAPGRRLPQPRSARRRADDRHDRDRGRP